jgi:hypothetical protein
MTVIAEIVQERYRQNAKWGVQNHPDGTGGEDRKEAADLARLFTDVSSKLGRLTWMHILREEMLETFAETEPTRIRAELVQVAAVAAAWIEAIDRRITLGEVPK